MLVAVIISHTSLHLIVCLLFYLVLMSLMRTLQANELSRLIHYSLNCIQSMRVHAFVQTELSCLYTVFATECSHTYKILEAYPVKHSLSGNDFKWYCKEPVFFSFDRQPSILPKA